MKKLFIILVGSLLLAAAVLGTIAAGLSTLGSLISWESQPFQEAERKVSAISEIRQALKKLQMTGQPRPKSLHELLKLIPEKSQEQLRSHEMLWNPHAEIIFVIKVNEDFGFTINKDLHDDWLRESGQVDLHFPKPNK